MYGAKPLLARQAVLGGIRSARGRDHFAVVALEKVLSALAHSPLAIVTSPPTACVTSSEETTMTAADVRGAYGQTERDPAAPHRITHGGWRP